MINVSISFQFELPNACNGNFLAMHVDTRSTYACSGPQKPTWCIAAVETYLDGGVLNAIKRA